MTIRFALGIAALLAAAFTAAQTTEMSPAPHARQLADGAAIYKQHCAKCHGEDGRGGGPAAAAMHFLPGDLTQLANANHGVFPSERVAQIVLGSGPAAHGSRLMPVWGDVFTRTARDRDTAQQRVNALVRFLEAIQQRSTE